MTSQETVKRIVNQKAAHFLDLAHRGSGPGASGGERRAKALADAIVDHAPGLDDEAIDGAVAFLMYAARFPTSAGELY